MTTTAGKRQALTETVNKAICKKDESGKCIVPELISARELWQSNLIYWIKSYKALLKYVSKNYTEIFKPIVKGDASGKRYYVSVENIVEFLLKFENNEL